MLKNFNIPLKKPRKNFLKPLYLDDFIIMVAHCIVITKQKPHAIPFTIKCQEKYSTIP